MQRVEERAPQRLGVEPRAARGEEVGPSDVADEERVAGQDPVGGDVVGVLVDEHADRLGGVPGRGSDLEQDLTEHEALPVRHRLDGEVDVGALAEGDHRAGRGGELQVPREEVGVEVRLEHPLDAQILRRGLLEVQPDVAARVDDDGPAGRLVTDQVGRVRQAREVVLGEDHGVVTVVVAPRRRARGRPAWPAPTAPLEIVRRRSASPTPPASSAPPRDHPFGCRSRSRRWSRRRSDDGCGRAPSRLHAWSVHSLSRRFAGPRSNVLRDVARSAHRRTWRRARYSTPSP